MPRQDPQLCLGLSAANSPDAPGQAPFIAKPTHTRLVLGGVPLATDLSRLLRRPLLQVRPAPKEYGTFQRVEGPAVAGDRALLVDDVVRSGRHLGSAVSQLRNAGLVVNAAACVIVRSPAGAGLLSELGVTLHSLIAADASQSGVSRC